MELGLEIGGRLTRQWSAVAALAAMRARAQTLLAAHRVAVKARLSLGLLRLPPSERIASDTSKRWRMHLRVGCCHEVQSCRK